MPALHRLPAALAAATLALAACQPAADAPTDPSPGAAPPLTNAADSLAWRMVSATGTPEAWARVPFLRFDFHSSTPGDTTRTRPPRRHLWDRQSGAYRLEMARPDSAIVALFNVNEAASEPRSGRVFVNGTAVADTAVARRWLGRAYSAFVNDSYWLLAPSKLFDPGVTRAIDADSSARDGAPVLRVSFDGVGLTPGDRYWLRMDPATGRLDSWQFHLEGSDAPGPRIRWTPWTAFATPAGDTLHLAPDHVNPSGRIVHTDAIAFPATVPEGVFTDPAVSMP